MIKRQLILNKYKTADTGLWTLTSCKLAKANQVQTFVSVPGRFAPLDLSTASTDGVPYYDNATLEAVLESSEGTREARQARIDYMVNTLDGYNMQIVHPDHPDHYLIGRVQVHPEYNDLAHGAVMVSAVCEPWLYSSEVVELKADPPGTEESPNLLDLSQMEVRSGSYDPATQSVTCDIYNGFYTLLRDRTLNDLILSSIGQTFTFSIKEPLEGAALSIVIYGTRTSGEVYQEVNSHYGARSVSITVADDFTDILFLEVRVNRQWTKFSDTSTTVYGLQLEAGDTATAYRPYHLSGELPIELVNSGRMILSPTVVITGEVTLKQGTLTQTLGAGTYTLPWLQLQPGSNWVICSGEGTATFTYREAVLAG